MPIVRITPLKFADVPNAIDCEVILKPETVSVPVVLLNVIAALPAATPALL